MIVAAYLSRANYKLRKTIEIYDLMRDPDPDSISDEDIRRSRKIASRISNLEGHWLCERSTSAPWANVPLNAGLARADPFTRNKLYQAAEALYFHFYSSDVPTRLGVGKIHKVLHMKRRNLFPVLDTELRRLYRAQARTTANALDRHGAGHGDRYHYWGAIRQDLLLSENQEGLKRIRRHLAQSSEDLARRAARVLSDLRLLDILGWAIKTGKVKI